MFLASTEVVRISSYRKMSLQIVLQNAKKETRQNNIGLQSGLNKRFAIQKNIGLVCATLEIPHPILKGHTL